MPFLEKEIKAAFEAAGGRLDDMDGTIQEMKAYVDQTITQMRRLGKGLMSGTLDGKDYPGFWPNESMAKDFAAIFAQACKRDFPGIDTKDMGTIGSEGGVLIPSDLAEWIIQKLGKYSKFRKNAMTLKMGTGRLWMPKVSSDLTIYAPGEGQTITKSDVNIAMVKLEAIKLACLTAVNAELDADSIVGIAEVIGMSVTRSLAKKEDLIGFMGDGSSTYFGMRGIIGSLLAVDGTIGNIKGLKVASGNAYAEITLADFEGVVAILPDDADEDAKWYMNRKFYFGVVMPLARAAGVANLFEILGDRKERWLMGYPVEFVSCMPSTEANSQICAVLGDLKMGAYLGERRQLEIARSDQVYFAADQIGFRGIERIDVNAHGVGDTTDAGPIVGLITAAS